MPDGFDPFFREMSSSEKIKQFRKEKGFTQRQLADLTGLAEITIRQYEAGKYEPKLDKLRRIAAALNVSIGDLDPNWGYFTQDEIRQDLSYLGGGFYGKEAPAEMQEKFMQRLTSHKTEMSRKMDMLNDSGQKEAVRQVELLTKIPEYRKDDQPPTPDN